MGWTSLTIGEVGASILGLAGILGVWWKIVRPAARLVRTVVGFLDDWNGTPEERDAAGGLVRQAQPGISARLAGLEHELHPNHGSSIKDSTTRTETAVARLDDAVRALDTKLSAQLATLTAADEADRKAAAKAHQHIHDRIDQVRPRLPPDHVSS